jgi:hypothetical protein
MDCRVAGAPGLLTMTRISIFGLALLVGVPVRFAGQTLEPPVPAETGLACIEDMQIPLYGVLAWMARATGALRAQITIGPDASHMAIDVRGEPPVLRETLKSALREARFSAQCAGKTLILNFVYRLEGSPDATLHSTVRLKRGNTFEILARPHILIPPQASATAPAR